jgi:hypothetical protein
VLLVHPLFVGNPRIPFQVGTPERATGRGDLTDLAIAYRDQMKAAVDMGIETSTRGEMEGLLLLIGSRL